MDSQERLSLRMPRHLDDPDKLLWWDFDVVLVAMSMFVLGIVGDMVLSGAILSFFLGKFYGSFKSGKARGFTTHMSYWYLPLKMNFKVIPDSEQRFFVG